MTRRGGRHFIEPPPDLANEPKASLIPRLLNPLFVPRFTNHEDISKDMAEDEEAMNIVALQSGHALLG